MASPHNLSEPADASCTLRSPQPAAAAVWLISAAAADAAAARRRSSDPTEDLSRLWEREDSGLLEARSGWKNPEDPLNKLMVNI